MAKAIEDSLVSLGFFPDDSPAYVARSIIEVDVVRKPKPKKENDAPGPEDHAINEDQVVITINSLTK